MKKKIFFAIVLIILVISEISVVYADLMITEHYFNNDGYVENDYAENDYAENDDVEKIGPFLEMVGSPMKEITALVTILSYVLGMVIISFNYGNDKNDNENNNSKNISQKIYLGMNFVLNLLQIQILKNALIFYSGFTWGIASSIRIEKISHGIITLFYIVYVIIMTLISKFCIKRKKEKAMCITITIITILLFIICAVIVYKTPAGYYTYDDILGF